MSDLLIACPNCGARYDGTQVRPGAKVRCSKCKTVFEATVQVSAPKPPPDKLVGRKIGGYEVLSKIGVGGIGAVYKARQISLDRVVAFKTLKPEFAQNESFITRLKREARSSAQISHTNIVQTYDVGQDQDVSFIAMEFVEGETLQDKLTREGGVEVKFGVNVLQQSAKALAFAYQAGIVHRDIKPDNLIIAKDGTIKVADFGLAKRIDVDVSLTQSGTIVGTPRYMSPEQGNGEPLDFRSDIYSLGASVYHALAGVPPFDAPTAMAVIVKHINDPLPPLRAMAPRVPPKFAKLIQRMMAKEADDRFQTPDDLLSAIADVKSTLAADMAAVERGDVEDETLITPVVDPSARTQSAARPVKAKTKARRRAKKAVVWALVALAGVLLLLALGRVLRDKKYGREIEADFEQRVAAAQECHNEERFQDAIDAFSGFPPDDAPNYDTWAQKAEERRERYLEFANKKFETQANKARDAMESQEFSQARAIYQDILESFGVPSILDDAAQRHKAVVTQQEKAIGKLLAKLDREIQTNGAEGAAAQELYSQIRLLKGDARLSASLEERLERAGERIREQRGGAKILYVSKKGKQDYHTVAQALNKVFKDDTIEIRDSEVYEEGHLASTVPNVTIRGAAGETPVIRLRFSGRGGKGGLLHDLLLRVPAIKMAAGCTFENVIFDLSRTPGGIALQGDGDCIMRSCAVLGIRTFGVAVGGKVGAKMARKGASLKVTDCIFTAVRGLQRGGPPRVIALNYGENQHIDMEFRHNIVCGGVAVVVRPIGDPKSRLVADGNIFESNALLTLCMGPNIRSPQTFFDYNCYSNGPKDFYGEMEEPRGRMRRPFRGMDLERQVTHFEDWVKQTKGDKHSVRKPSGLRSPETGDFRLTPESPCIAKGRDGSDIGLLTSRILPRALFPGGEKEPGHAQPPKPDRASRKTMQQVETRIKELLEQQRYDQAIKAVSDGMKGSPQVGRRVRNIELMKALKSLVVERISSGAKPSLPQTLVKQETYAHLTGGSIVRATTEYLVAADKTGSQETKIPWSKLTGEEFVGIAKSKECTDIQNGHQQLQLGVYCFELNLWDKAQTYLRYAKSSINSSELDRRMAEDLLRMAEGLAQKDDGSSAAARDNAAEKTEITAADYIKIQEYFEEKHYKDALALANAYAKQHADDIQLRLRLGNLLWVHLETAWKSRDVAYDVRTRWVKMIWQLLSSGIEKGDKVAGKQTAEEVLEKLANLAKKMGVALPAEAQKRGTKNGG